MNLFLKDLYNLVDHRLRLIAAVEEERIVYTSGNGEIVKPRTCVCNTPQSYARNLSAMAIVNIENVEITLFKLFFNILWKSVLIRIQCISILEVLAYLCSAKLLRIRQDIYIKLSNHHLNATGSKGIYRLLVFIKVGIFESVVRLHSDTVNAVAFRLQLSDNTANSIALCWLCQRIVVDIEFRIWIGLVGKLKCKFNKFRTYYAIIWRITEGAVIVKNLVYDIPSKIRPL